MLTAVNGIFYNMAEQIDIKLNIQGDSIKAFREELKKTKKELDNTTDPKKAEKLSKSFEEGKNKLVDYNKQLRETKKATDSAVKSNTDLNATFEDIYGDVKPLSSRLGELEDRMYEMALAGEANSEEFRTLQKEAVRMRKTIIEVDKQVDILADNQGFSVFGDGLADVGTSLMRLDFETASKQASSLANAAKSISFGSAIKSIKQLGSVFLNLGKALLTNPLFLIAAIVAAIIAAIVKLMDELGFLTTIFEAVGAAIGWVVQQFKDFLDWLGLTSYAEKDAAEASAKAAEKRARAYEEATARITAALDHEIRMAELAGKDTEALERKKVIRLRDTNKAQLRALKARYKAEKRKGELDYKELAALAKSVRDKRAEYKQSLRDVEYFYAQTEKERADAIKKQKEQAAEELAQLEADRKQRFEDYKAYRNTRIEIEREIQDAELELMQDGFDKQQKEIQLNYDRLIEDAKLNEELTQSERARLIELYGKQRIQAEKEIQRQIREAEQASNKEAEELEKQRKQDFLTELEAWQEEQYQLSLTDQEREITAVQDKYFRLLEMARQHGEDTAALEEAQKKQIAAINDKYRQAEERKEEAKTANDKALANQKVQLALDSMTAINGLVQAFAKDDEKSAKRAFNVNKAFGIAQAVVSTAQAIVAQLAVPQDALTGANFVKAGIAAATGAAQIATIAKQKFEPSSGGSGSAASISQPPTPAIMGQQQQAGATPIMNLNEGIEQNAGGSTIREKVMVVDYTDIQNKGNELVQVENSFTLA